MLGVAFEESRLYREVKEEGRKEILAITVPLLLKRGMTIGQIADQLQVDIEAIRRAAQD
ncbi:MAG: hypothetical protein WA902_14115 [Thermosynechococcaceae cyanobacterium]